MFRVIKESETVDERGHCFLLQTVGRESRYFSMETRQDLLRLESAWHRAVCQSVSGMKSTTFHVVYKNVPGALTLDWTDGFLLKPFASPTYAFTYSFSQLKGSSDDGNATLTLNFQDPVGSNNFVEQVSILSKLLETHKFPQRLLKNFLLISGDNLPQTSRIALFHARFFDGQSCFSGSCFHVSRKFRRQSTNVIFLFKINQIRSSSRDKTKRHRKNGIFLT